MRQPGLNLEELICGALALDERELDRLACQQRFTKACGNYNPVTISA